MPEDRTLELHTNASQGALEYLRLARDSLACINDGGARIVTARHQLDHAMKAVENFHTEVARKLRYKTSTMEKTK
jgi:hypothetical protein